MAGTLKVGGNTIATHTGVEGAGTVTLSNVALGTTSAPIANNLVFANGNGIDFSAAAGSASGSSGALLDDYEEGTWTPTIGLGVSSPTYTKQEGSYVKAGNIVLVSCTLAISSGTTNGSTLRIDGFPFTAFNLTDVAFINCVKPNSVAQFGADVIVYINSNATTAFLNINDATSALGFNGNYFGSSGSISFSLIYRST